MFNYLKSDTPKNLSQLKSKYCIYISYVYFYNDSVREKIWENIEKFKKELAEMSKGN